MWGEPPKDRTDAVLDAAERKVEDAARAVARNDSPSDVADLRDALDDLDALRRGDTLTGGVT
jgi:hypothetical protein